MSDLVKETTDATFTQDVLESQTPVLVDFWAPWCGPCRMVAPVLEKVAQEYAGKVNVVKLNVDDSPQVSMQYGIRSIPTIALFVGGQPVTGVMGAVPQKVFNEMLDKHLPQAASASVAS